MKTAALLSLIAALLTGLGYAYTKYAVLLPVAITCGTIAYHLLMRLLVGLAYNKAMKNRADCSKRWYRVGRREAAFYEKIGVRKWKKHMPSYDASLFDPKIHTWSEIAQAMCQAELVHETIIPLSFLPIAAGRYFGAYPVFIITSVLSALFDMLFVIMQRYNRPRVLRLAEQSPHIRFP